MNKKSKVILIICLVSLASVAGVFSFVFLPTLFDSFGPVPQYVNEDWIELDKIAKIGKYRSTIGHGYPGDGNPTSDKHYFYPKSSYGYSNDTIRVYSPVNTKVTKIVWEQHQLSDGTIRGKQIHIQSIEHPSITFVLFHINIEPTGLQINQELIAGQWIGYCDCREGASNDIAIHRGTGTISWFEVITDSLFSAYNSRGITNRSLMIKTDAQVAESATNGYNFSNSDPADWIDLN